jgi:peptide subunit release factor RF-3
MYELARWIELDAADLVPRRRGVLTVRDQADRLLVLFTNRFALESVEAAVPQLGLRTEPPPVA